MTQGVEAKRSARWARRVRRRKGAQPLDFEGPQGLLSPSCNKLSRDKDSSIIAHILGSIQGVLHHPASNPALPDSWPIFLLSFQLRTVPCPTETAERRAVPGTPVHRRTTHAVQRVRLRNGRTPPLCGSDILGLRGAGGGRAPLGRFVPRSFGRLLGAGID